MKQQYCEIADEGLLDEDDEVPTSTPVTPPAPPQPSKAKTLTEKISKRTKLGKFSRKQDTTNNNVNEKKGTSSGSDKKSTSKGWMPGEATTDGGMLPWLLVLSSCDVQPMLV